MHNNWKSQSGPSRTDFLWSSKGRTILIFGPFDFLWSSKGRTSGRYKFIRLIQIISFLAQAIVHGSIVAKIATYNHESKIIM